MGLHNKAVRALLLGHMVEGIMERERENMTANKCAHLPKDMLSVWNREGVDKLTSDLAQ